MRRFVSLLAVLLFGLPIGASLAGCHKTTAPTYCNGTVSGPQVGQLAFLDLEPRLTGISLNQGQISSVSSPSGTDCKNNTVGIGSVTYGTLAQGTNASTNVLLDIVPGSGRICAGVWNRNSGGGVPDYSICNPGTLGGVTYVVASSGGVSSNAIPVYVHPVVTNIVLGPGSTNCATDPASNCTTDPTQTNGCGVAVASTASTQPYDGLDCVSQGASRTLVARSYSGNSTSAANNISCLVGPLTFTAQNTAIGTIQTVSNSNGTQLTDTITAAAPGSSIINASAGASQASSSAGFFSTCPPASITLTTQGSTVAPTAAVPINQNVTQNLVVNVVDKHNVPITNIALSYQSTSPQTIPTAMTGSTVTPVFPGAASITAVCQPPTCNTSSFSQIGIFGNGTPIFSNPLQVTTNGSNSSTVLYVGSTSSQYLLPIDFTSPSQAALVRLPYVPNSMVITQDLSTIYMGTTDELMVFNTTSNSLTRQDVTVSGYVLAVSPSGSVVVITDPVRNLVYLYNSGGSVMTQYGGTGVSAQWTPDSSTVFVTTTDGRLLAYSTFTGWNAVPLQSNASSVSVTVPDAGAYLGNSVDPNTGNAQGFVTARTVCPQTTVTATGLNAQSVNTFYPQADQVPSVSATSVATTSDGLHVFGASPTVGATAGVFSDINTNAKTGACAVQANTQLPNPPVVTFTSSPNASIPFSGGVAPTAMPTAIPPSPQVLVTSDAAYGFVTYTGSGSAVPQYNPATRTLTNIPLQTTAAGKPTAPVAGAVTTDNQTLYVGTSGDNLVHILKRGTGGFSDTTTPVAPQLPSAAGTGLATPNLLVLRPRKSTN